MATRTERRGRCTRMGSLPWICAAFLALGLAGCATVYEGKYPFNDGWRKATVESVGEAPEITKRATKDCRIDFKGDMHSQFARLTYSFSARMRRSAIVPVPRGVLPKPGEVAYVNPRKCRLVPLVAVEAK